MAGLLVVFFPLFLLAFLLFMERVERPLTRDAVGPDVEEFLDTASREDVNNVFLYGVRRSLERWRNRRRMLPKLAALVTLGREDQEAPARPAVQDAPEPVRDLG